MAIEKSMNPAPQGLSALTGSLDEPALEIEIEDPESVKIGIGDMVINLEKEDDKEDGEFEANLAEEMSEAELTSLASDLISDFEDDISSRKDWMQTYVDGLELLGMKIEERSEPWEGACGVYHPLLAEALVKFQSETIMETFPAAGPVKTQIIGKDTPAKAEAAVRVQDDMNYRLTDEMTEYRPEQERLLWGLGLSGNAFKKVYFDPALDRPTAMFCAAEDVVVPYGASNLETADRVTHVMRKTKNELRRLQVAGFYRDIDLDDPVNTMDEVEKKIAEKMGFRATTDDRYKLLEMQVFLDLPGYEDVGEDGKETGIALPYIVTIDKSSSDVLSIRRNWRPEDETKQKRSHFVHYGYVPGFGFYCFGLIHLIGAYAKSGTSILRQLVDAGTLSNLPGGLKSKGLRVKGDDTPISPGEFRDVDVASGTIRDNILPLPYKEPSQVLAALMDKIVQEGRNFANAADMQVSDMSANSPVGTTLAILERTLKVMSAIQARIHYAMKQEFRLLRDIIRDCTPDDYAYDPEVGNRHAKKADYDSCEVIPVSDPNAATMSQKVVQYQAVIQLAQSAPQIYDLPELHKQMLQVLGIKNIGKLIPTEEDQKPKDPVSENMAVFNMKPVKAFIYQDHQAHMQVHQAAIQDPHIMQAMGQNPQAQAMMAAMQAHIAEHVGFEYRKQIEVQLGIPLPAMDEELSKEMEVQLSQLLAMAASKLAIQSAAMAAQAQAQQTAQDPIVQMQQAELAIKQKEVELKEKKIMVDAAAKADQQEIEKTRIASQEQIAGMQVGAKTAKDRAELQAKMELAGVQTGSDIKHKQAALALQTAQMARNGQQKGEVNNG